MIDLDRIADLLMDWESLDPAERPDDPAALHSSHHLVEEVELAEVRRRAELLRRFDDAFGLSPRTIDFASSIVEAGLPKVPGCTIRGVLGRGGMGVVYRAWQEDLQREVAVKVLSGATGNIAARSRRFAQEARVLARLRHEHIVPLFHADLHLGEPFFVMELMTGGSLAGAREHFAEPRAAVGLVEQVARAVQHAHDQEILHRDLKPANILLDERGKPRVSDFGLAKLFAVDDECARDRAGAFSDDTPDEVSEGRLTATNAVVGTPLYMAPEQFITPGSVGPAVDIWALGVILYELLTGQRPFGPRSPGGLSKAIVERDPPRPRSLKPQLSPGLEAIVLKCLAKSPADRYPSAAALADDLGRWLAGLAPIAYPESRSRRLWRFIRRHSTAAVIVALVVLGAALGAASALTSAVVAYRNDPERVRESIAETLEARRPATLIKNLGPPRLQDFTIGADTALRSTDASRPYFVSTNSLALIELWPNPPPIYRFEVDIRHDDNPADGAIGLFFDYRVASAAVAQPTCYVFSYTDRGSNARRLTLPGGQLGSRVALTLQNFEPGPNGTLFDHAHRIDNRIAHVPPMPALGPSPWRRLRIDVGAQAVALHWLPGEGGLEQRVHLDDAVFQKQARLVSGGVPDLRRYEGRPATRGPLGLYVSRSAASFRNAVLESLSVEP